MWTDSNCQPPDYYPVLYPIKLHIFHSESHVDAILVYTIANSS